MPSAPLTVGPTLPNEVSVELVVHVDLHVVHPVNLQEENRMDSSSQGHGMCHSPRHATTTQVHKLAAVAFVT